MGKVVDIFEWRKSQRGGQGSGNFGHEGRPGQIGGSGGGGGKDKVEQKINELVKEHDRLLKVANDYGNSIKSDDPNLDQKVKEHDKLLKEANDFGDKISDEYAQKLVNEETVKDIMNTAYNSDGKEKFRRMIQEIKGNVPVMTELGRQMKSILNSPAAHKPKSWALDIINEEISSAAPIQ